jgi:hypothetical protein
MKRDVGPSCTPQPSVIEMSDHGLRQVYCRRQEGAFRSARLALLNEKELRLLRQHSNIYCVCFYSGSGTIADGEMSGSVRC